MLPGKLPKGSKGVEQSPRHTFLPEDEAEYAKALARVSWVLLPIIFTTGALAHFEKGNLAFAALQLNKQLRFTALEYGVGSGLYFLGFGVGIIPSTFSTIKYGARRWLGSITFACGVVGMLHSLISNHQMFYVLRCVLGLMEAGSMSSTGHLLAQFYPKDKLALPFTVAMLSYFAAGILAAPMATGLMSLDGVGGLHGWQWLFLVEAVPSLLLGVVMWCWLPSHPLSAWMLTHRQREVMHLKVHGSVQEAEAARVLPRWSQLLAIMWITAKRPLLWFFTTVSLLHGISFFSIQPWTTIIINNMLHGTAVSHSTSSGSSSSSHYQHSYDAATGETGGHYASNDGNLPTKAILLSAVPAVSGSIAATLCAWHSDKRGEKHLHVAVPWLVSGVLLSLFGPTNNLSFVVGFVTLVLAKSFSNACSGVMSSLLVGCLDTKHAGIGLAMSHAVVACLAGFAGPVLVGALVQRTGGFSQAMVVNGSLQITAALLMLGLVAWNKGFLNKRKSSEQLHVLPLVAAAAAAAAAAGGPDDSSSSGTQPDVQVELVTQAETAAAQTGKPGVVAQ